MMNYIWCGIMLFSLVTSIFTGRLESTVNAGITAAQNSVTTVLSFAGIMCMWSGIMKIADKSGITDIIGKILSPITKLLFPRLKRTDEAMRQITMNITANLLGMGNAATPLGLSAMRSLDTLNKKSRYASDEMCIFAVLNTASFQLIPTTIMALRTASGSANPSEIIFPIWIVSLMSLLCAVIAVKIMLRRNIHKLN